MLLFCHVWQGTWMVFLLSLSYTRAGQGKPYLFRVHYYCGPMDAEGVCWMSSWAWGLKDACLCPLSHGALSLGLEHTGLTAIVKSSPHLSLCGSTSHFYVSESYLQLTCMNFWKNQCKIFCLETDSLYVAQTSQRSSCLCLPSAEMKSVCHLIWREFFLWVHICV